MKDIPVEMIPVNTTSFSHMGFDKSTEKLYIRFARGAEYEYSNVSESIYKEISDSPSRGSALRNIIIKNPETYPFIKL